MIQKFVSNIVNQISDRVRSNIVNQIKETANEPIRALYFEYSKFGVVDPQTLANARVALGLNDPNLERFLERYQVTDSSHTVSINDVVPLPVHNELKERLYQEHRDQIEWATKCIELQKIIDALRAENDKLKTKE